MMHSLLLVGDSTLFNKFRYLTQVLKLKSSCTSGPGVCFRRNNETLFFNLGKTVKQRARSFDVVVFNSGLHNLHLMPMRTTALQLSLSQFEQRLARGVRKLEEHFAEARLFYKQTNWVCSGKFVETGRDTRGYVCGVARWRSPAMWNHSLYSMQMTEVGAQALRAAEKRVVASTPRWALLDSFTNGDVCACTGEGDGRHFVPLIPQFVLALAEAINSSAVATAASLRAHERHHPQRITRDSTLSEAHTNSHDSPLSSNLLIPAHCSTEPLVRH